MTAASRRTTVMAWTAASLTLSAALAAVVLLALNVEDAGAFVFSYALGGVSIGVSFAVVGGLLAARIPDNALGWVFLAVGLSQSFDSLATEYAGYGLVTAPGQLPGAAVMDWLATWMWAPGAALMGTLTLLLFPTGHPPSRTWRWVPWAVAAAIALMVIPVAVVGWPLRGHLSVQPDVPARIAGGFAYTLQAAGLTMTAAAMLASVIATALRFRRAGAQERAQLKWLVYAGFVTLLFIALVAAGGPEQLAGVGLAVGIGFLLLGAPSIPLAVGIAVLRYRLYEIDRIISRTVSYALVTALLGGLYTLGVLVLGLFAPFGEDSQLAVATSTLAVAAVFGPVRRRVQTLVDWRFNRARYDAARILEDFRARLRHEVDLGHLSQDVLEVVQSTVQPQRVALWLRAGDPER